MPVESYQRTRSHRLVVVPVVARAPVVRRPLTPSVPGTRGERRAHAGAPGEVAGSDKAASPGAAPDPVDARLRAARFSSFRNAVRPTEPTPEGNESP
ncbi:hypothetical protein CLM82_19810 [Streptomyces albidoflavus]|nr:hypothetical protein CLM82_19810 [Streptomyces albidoflavus]